MADAASRLPGITLGRVGHEIGSNAGLAAMATLRMIEWEMAAVIAGVHTVERYGRRKTVRELAAGLESGI
jgi:hypothetical protein